MRAAVAPVPRGGGVGERPGHFVHRVAQIVDFPRPRHLGVGAQDLFHQGGAGAGRADNEYDAIPRIAVFPQVPLPFRREEFGDALHLALGGVAIIGRARRQMALASSR